MRRGAGAALAALALAAAACSGSTHHAGRTTPQTTSPQSISQPTAPTTTQPRTAIDSATGGTAPCVATTLAPGRSSQKFAFEGEQRTYQLYVPHSYDGTHRVPVVFDFHGYGSSALQQIYYGNFMPEAEQDGFIIVAPDGQGSPLHFNLTGEPGLQNDLTMVGALLDHIEATMCIDPLRVYATGMSDGGAMTSVLACESDRFAAFGAVTLVVLAPGCAARPVAIVAFSGTADPIVPFNGGTIHCCGNASIGAAPTTMAGWAAHDGCGKAPIDVQLSSEVDRRTWTGCSRGTVVFYIIDGGGHTWPGAIPAPFLGKTTRQISASSTIWAFFKAHPLAG